MDGLVQRKGPQQENCWEAKEKLYRQERKLGSALTKIPTQAGDDAHTRNQVARGLELLFIVFGYYSASIECRGRFCILNSFKQVTQKGEHIDAFHNAWVMVLTVNSKQPDNEIFELLLR